MLSTFWLVACRWSRFAVLMDPRTVVHGAGDVNNPDLSSSVPALSGGLQGAQYFFTFLSRFRSPYYRPILSGPQVHVRPQEKKSAMCCRFESRNDSEFIARNSAFYMPKIALHRSITDHVTNTSLPVQDFSSLRTCIFNIDYFTHLSQLS